MSSDPPTGPPVSTGADRRLRIAYHDPDPTPLLRHGVGPLVVELNAAGLASRWSRHWRRGPHIRVVVTADDAAWERTVAPAVRRHLTDPGTGALTRHPSTGRFDLAAALPAHRLLADRERERGPLEPLQPDNTVEQEDHDPRGHVLGSAAAVALFDEFAQRTNGAALAVACADRSARARHALDLMVLVAATVGDDVTRGYLSYRSHAESYLMQCADPAAMRARFAASSAAVGPHLAARLTELRAGGAQAPGVDRPTATVAAEIERSAHAAVPLLAAGLLTLDSDGDGDGVGSGSGDGVVGPTAAVAHSAFHQALRATPAYLEALRTDPWFRRYRVALNLTYLHLSRTGVGQQERFLYCHTLADAVERTHGLDAVRMMTNGVGPGNGDRT